MTTKYEMHVNGYKIGDSLESKLVALGFYRDPFLQTENRHTPKNHFTFEVFGDPETLSCDRDSQGDVYFADMSHTVCRADCIEKIDEGLLPQKWMEKKYYLSLIKMDVISMSHGRLICR